MDRKILIKGLVLVKRQKSRRVNHSLLGAASALDHIDMDLLSLIFAAVSLMPKAAMAKAIYPAQSFDARGVERIEITGVRGSVRLTGHPGKAYLLKVAHSKNRNSNDWNLSVERRGRILVLEVANIAFGREWRRQVRREDWPEFDLELTGPNVPAMVSWREGILSFQNWRANVDATFLSGRALVKNSSGKHRLQLMSGEVEIQNFAGDLRLDVGNGSIQLADLRGSSKIDGLSEILRARNVEGKIAVEARQLDAQIESCSGNWKVEAERGTVAVREFNGRFQGQGAKTSWLLDGEAASDVEVVNSSGPVKVKWRTKPKVFLTTNRGSIHSPFGIQEDEGRRVSLSGQKSRLAFGQIFVKTDTGDITYTH